MQIDGGRKIVAFDPVRYPFRAIMASHLGVGPLEFLHRYYEVPPITAENDQETPLHREMYRVGSDFADVYRNFVREWVQPVIGSPVVFQAVPSFRYQAPGTVAVGAWHRDSDFGHVSEEVNVWVPLTRVEPSSAVWVESSPGAEDFAPALVPLGAAMLFDAVSLKHGNQVNSSLFTRVSFEFRVIKESCYVPRSEKSVKQRRLFRVGEYFDRFD